jgi:WD40 repeat protein
MELTKPASYVFSTIFSPDGKYAFSGSLDNIVAIWDLETGKQTKALRVQIGEAPGISALSLSPEGKYLLTGSKGGGVVKLWSTDSWEEIRSLPGHSWTEAMEAFSFSSDGKYAVSGGSYLIKQWDLESGNDLSTITHASFFDRNQSYAMAFSPNGRLAFVKGIGFISLWDIKNGKKLWIRGAETGGERGGRMIFNSSASFSPDGDSILSGEGETVRLRDAATGKTIRIFVDQGTGHIDAVAFSSDGKYIVSGSVDNTIRIWDARTGAKLNTFVGHSDDVASVAFSRDGRRLLSGGDASTRLWNVSTGEELAAMIEFGEKEWLIITPEGYYNASENGAQYISVMVGDSKYGVDKFYDVFYRPDIVAAKLRGENIRDLITITMQDAIKSPPPAVEIKQLDEKDASAKVCYRINSNGGGIGEVRLFHNGKLIQSDGYYRDMAKSTSANPRLMAMNSKAIYENMRSVTIKGRGNSFPASSVSKGEIVEDCIKIEPVPGENEVSIAAFNSSNTVQSHMKTTRFNSNQKPGDPHLYILSIGIDKYRDSSVDLKYATKDASDIEQKLLKQPSTVYKPQNIHYELLTDNNAGKGSIMDKINELSRKIKPDDGFILFLAGHGVLLQNQYYMLTHDFNGSMSETNMISSNEIVEMSKKIRSLSQLFIFDTCHAGGVDTIVSGLYDARMSILAKKMGLHIYASANSIEEAQDGYRGNGLFTYTLLNGLDNQKEADRNNDNIISLVELGAYAKQATTELSKKNGRSQTPLIINFGKDIPLYNLK